MHPALKWLWDYEFCIRKLEKPPCILAHIFSLFLPFIMLATSSLSQVCICLEASLKSVSFVATGLHAYTYELPFYSKKASLEKLCLFCRTIIWTRDSRMVFWCLAIDILLRRSSCSSFLLRSIHVNRFSTKTVFVQLLNEYANAFVYESKSNHTSFFI